MKKLNSGLLNSKLKAGWSIADFAQYFDCSEEEFLILFDKEFFGKTHNDLLRRLKKNSQKSPHPKNRTSAKSTKVENSEVIPVSASSESDNSEEAAPETSVEQSISSSNLLLDELKAKEQKLISYLCKQEISHNNLLAKRKSLKDSLTSQKEVMEEIREKLISCQNQVNTTIDELSKISAQIVEVNSEISTTRTELSKVQNDIKLSNKVNIFAYESGETDFENFSSEIPNSWEEIYKNLLASDNSSIEELSLKQLKQIAKVIALAKLLREKDIIFEVSFENSLAMQLFDEFSN